MSRSGYSYELDNWDMIRWRGAVAAATRGRRGQALLRELRDALNAMPDKKLIADDFATPEGEVCALGALGVQRGMARLSEVDESDYDSIAADFGVAPALVQEIEDANDDQAPSDPAKRWAYMRDWVDARINDA